MTPRERKLAGALRHLASVAFVVMDAQGWVVMAADGDGLRPRLAPDPDPLVVELDAAVRAAGAVLEGADMEESGHGGLPAGRAGGRPPKQAGLQLYVCRVRGALGRVVFGCHVMAREAKGARAMAGTAYERQRSPEAQEAMRRADPVSGGAMADHLAELPPLEACKVVVLRCTAKNPPDWATEMETEGRA